MASIRSRNGRYQVQVRRAGLGSRSRTFVRKQDAERWARKMEAQFDQGELQQLRTKDVVLHDLIDRYRREITPAKKSRDTEGVRLTRLMRDPIASLTVNKLTAHEQPRSHLEGQQTEFMAGLFGGPKIYGGRPPQSAHVHMYITEEVFFTRHILLEEALDEANVRADLKDQWLDHDMGMKRALVKNSLAECEGRYKNEPVIVVEKPR